MDMPLFWVKDFVDQHQFTVYWAPGQLNLGDFFMKLTHPKHMQLNQTSYVQPYQGINNVALHCEGVLIWSLDLPSTTTAASQAQHYDRHQVNQQRSPNETEDNKCTTINT